MYFAFPSKGSETALVNQSIIRKTFACILYLHVNKYYLWALKFKVYPVFLAIGCLSVTAVQQTKKMATKKPMGAILK